MAGFEALVQQFGAAYKFQVSDIRGLHELMKQFEFGTSAEKELALKLLDFATQTLIEQKNIALLVEGSILDFVRKNANFGDLELKAAFDPDLIEAGTLRFFAGHPQLQNLLRTYGVKKADVIGQKPIRMRGGYGQDGQP